MCNEQRQRLAKVEIAVVGCGRLERGLLSSLQRAPRDDRLDEAGGGVTMHGIALNVDPNMEHFQYITPCGLDDVVMTSLSYEAHKPVPMPQVIESFTYHFRRVFECQAEEVQLTPHRAAS